VSLCAELLFILLSVRQFPVPSPSSPPSLRPPILCSFISKNSSALFPRHMNPSSRRNLSPPPSSFGSAPCSPLWFLLFSAPFFLPHSPCAPIVAGPRSCLFCPLFFPRPVRPSCGFFFGGISAFILSRRFSFLPPEAVSSSFFSPSSACS